jgi:acyl-CoA dehydrogenase
MQHWLRRWLPDPGPSLHLGQTAMSIETASGFSELREAVRALCATFPPEYWRELDEQRAYPEQFVRALTQAGWLSALIPEEYGGSGLGIAEASVILEEVNRCGGNSGACHAQMYIMGTLLRHGSPEQKQRYLPGIASGALRLQSFAVTEPSTGSDTTKLKTTAVRKGDRYVVNGQKVWTSRVQHSDLMLLLARTTPVPETKKKSDGLSVFLVDLRDSVGRGMTVRPIRNMPNHETNELFFDNLEVPGQNLIGEEGKGFRYILDGMNAERILIAAECVGDGRWFLEKATAYARERVVFDRPIGQNQGVQFPIARAYVNVEAANLMRFKAAELFDRGEPCGAQANMAKLLAADASWEAANACLQTHGGFGFAAEYDVERKFRETRLYQVAPISTNLILAYIAEHVLGLPRSY